MQKIIPAFLLLFLIASAYYFFETMIDTVPSVMVNELMQSFHLSAFKLGILDVSYFILAALVQIPGGYLLDKWGAKRVMPLAACICMLGLIIFSQSHSFAWALLGRMLAGLGSAFGLLGALFIIASRTPSRFLALALGVAITIGLSGALLDGVMASINQACGWRTLTLGLAVLGLGFAILFYFLLPIDIHSAQHQKYSWQQLIVLAKDRSLWFIALYGGIMYLPAGTLGSLWGANFIVAAVPGLSLPLASSLNSLIFLGWMIGSPLAGLATDLTQERRSFLIWGALICLSLLILLALKGVFSIWLITSLFLGLGLFSSFSGLTFAMGAERYQRARAMTIGWINMWAIVPMLIINPLFGHVLDHFQHFDLHAYQQALWPLIILVAIASIFSLKIKVSSAKVHS